MIDRDSRTRARRRMTDDDIREAGQLYATGDWTQEQLGLRYRVSEYVVHRSLDYYNAHLKSNG